MAPGPVADSAPQAPHLHPSKANSAPVDTNIFPDGIKTSGQHPPLYDLLHPYEDFPKEIVGPTVWKAEDYKNNPERWTHPFSDDEIAELDKAADAFLAAGRPLTAISKASWSSYGARRCDANERTGPLPASRAFKEDDCSPQRAAQRQGLHSLQGLPCPEVGCSQVSRRIHGSWYLSGILCLSERPRPRPRPRQGRW